VRSLLPSSLTGRLIATLVAVVLLTTVLVTVVTGIVMRNLLNGQLDAQVKDTLNHFAGEPSGARPAPPPYDDDDHDGPRFGRGDANGALRATFVNGVPLDADVLENRIRHPLSSTAERILGGVPADDESHVVDLPGAGSFRVRASLSEGVKRVAGQSTRGVDDAVGTLVFAEVLLGLGAVVVAVGAGRVLVRRQLRPLREVAATAHEVTALPLSSGEIGTTVRVPDELTDEATEVGQVGAALNTMLAHVERALDERHRSELQVRQFVADASHELRTPLTTIHGYAELSRRTRPADPEQLSQAMSKVEAEASRMSTLVDDLLLLARLDAGRPLARDEVDVTHLVLEAVSDARVVGPQHRWQLDLPDEPVAVAGDEQRLHQVLTNLLNNARRHTPPGTSVVVGVRAEGPDVVLWVQDDGPGLPPGLARTAFERFTRGDSARTRESGGAGLGLSLVQAITSAHGGRTSVTSEPGRTRFEVRFPALQEAAAVLHR
jgi:two-component system OmpR family sensor kinase